MRRYFYSRIFKNLSIQHFRVQDKSSIFFPHFGPEIKRCMHISSKRLFLGVLQDIDGLPILKDMDFSHKYKFSLMRSLCTRLVKLISILNAFEAIF